MCNKIESCGVSGECSCCKKPFDPTKPVKTRDGREARIICSDMVMASRKTIVALVKSSNQFCGEYTECAAYYHPDGKYLDNKIENSSDLVNVPVVRHEFINFYGSRSGGTIVVHKTREQADRGCQLSNGTFARAGLVKVTYEDGELVGVELVK